MPTDPLMIQYSTAAAPNNPTDTHLAVGSTATNATDAIDSSQSLAAYGSATSQMAKLQSLNAEEQRLAWNSATGSQQSMLAGVGYQPPKQPGRNWFSRGWHDVLGAPSALYRQATHIPVVGSGVEAVGNAVGSTASTALRVLGASGELVKHTYRTGAYENATHDNSLIDNIPLPEGVKNFYTGEIESAKAGIHYAANIVHLDTPSDWADAWHATTHGDQTFDPNKQRDIQTSSGYNDTVFGLAKAVAGSDKNVSDFLSTQLKAGMNPNDVAALENKVNDPQFQNTVQQLKDSKLSFGRSLVPQWMFNSKHKSVHDAAEIVSGAGDALFSFVDPTIIGGKVSKVAKVSKYGFRTLKELDKATQSQGFINWSDDVAKSLQKGDYAELMHRHPELAPTISTLAQDNVRTSADLAAKLKPTSTAGINDAYDAQHAAQNAVDRTLPQSREYAQAVKDAGLAGLKTQAEVAEWAKANVLVNHIFQGNGTAISHGVNLVPSLSPVGKAFLDSKDALRKAIDWTSDLSVDVGQNGATDIGGKLLSGTIGLAGTTAKRLTSLIPRGLSFNPLDPNAITEVQRFARAYLPSKVANTLVNRWAMAPDLASKRAVYTEMLSNTFKAAGVDLSDDNPLMTHYVNVIGKNGVQQKYAANGLDLMQTDNGMEAAHGFLEKHMTEEWSLPSMKDLFANANRGRFNKMVYGVSNNALAHSFSTIWKPLQLLRMGFPVRVSLEEVAGGTARNGPLEMAKAALAGRAIQGLVHNEYVEDETGKLVKHVVRDNGYGMVGALADLNPIEAAFARGLRMLPENVRPSVDTAQKLQSLLLANRTARAVRWVAGKAPGVDDYVDTAKKFPSIFKNAFTSEASSVHSAEQGFVNDIAEGRMGDFGDRMRKTSLSLVKPTGDYIQLDQGDEFFMSNWMKHLDDIAGSGVSRVVLQNLDLLEKDPAALRSLVAQHIQDPGFQKYWEAAIRSRKLRDAREVGYDATKADAANDWADVVIHHVDDMLPSGTHRNELASQLLKNKRSPDLSTLRRIPQEFQPGAVSGQEFADMPTGGLMGVFNEFVNKGFTRMGHAIDMWSRQPLYLAAVHKADKELAPLYKEMFGDSPMGEELLTEAVRQHANSQVLPFIHDPKIRSQMNVLTQNIAPFQFAQDQFWKRWAKTFVHSPEAMKEAQLAHHALGATGITHTDDSGNEIFTYPLTGFAQKAVAEGLNAVGIPAAVPVSQAFTGQLKMVAPGLDRTFAPSFGPLVSIPLNALAQKFPELQPAQHAALGDIGTNRPVLDEIFPATVMRTISAVFSDDRSSTQYANAEMRAIQDLYAKGHGLSPNASPQEKEQFMQRVKNWTRINMGIRAAFGFGAPAAPQSEIGNTKIGHELRVLSDSGLDFTTAMQALVERNPDAFPYTVFESVGTGSATLPSTEAAAAMLQDYSSFFKNHPSAGGFFLPTKSNNDKFSQQAYQEQLMNGLRKRKTPQEFLDNLMYAQAATDYYDTRDAYNLKVKNLRGSARDAAANVYQTWKEGYFNDHPVFAAELQSPDARLKRSTTLGDLKKALNDKSAPQTEQVKSITDLVDTYDAYQQQVNQLAGMTSARASSQRKAMKIQFATWAKQYIKTNPGALDVYNRLVRPDVDPEGSSTTGATNGS